MFWAMVKLSAPVGFGLPATHFNGGKVSTEGMKATISMRTNKVLSAVGRNFAIQ